MRLAEEMLLEVGAEVPVDVIEGVAAEEGKQVILQRAFVGGVCIGVDRLITSECTMYKDVMALSIKGAQVEQASTLATDADAYACSMRAGKHFDDAARAPGDPSRLAARWRVRRLHAGIRTAGLVLAAALALSGCSGALGDSGSNSVIPRDHEVLLVPNLDAGRAGWCLVRVNRGGEGGCGVALTNPPIIAEKWSSGGPPAVTTAYAITAKDVASVRPAGGPAVPTHAEKDLPDGLRAVAIEIWGKELLSEDQSLPHFMPLDGHGKVMPQANGRTWKYANVGTIATTLPTIRVTNAASWTGGICRIEATPPSGTTAFEGAVMTAAHSYTGLVGQGFLACADAQYTLHGFLMTASILLSAARPGQSPPALPAMTPLAGHAGIFQAPDEDVGNAGTMLAKRIKGAWIIVAEGESVAQRLKLLESIRPTVNL